MKETVRLSNEDHIRPHNKPFKNCVPKACVPGCFYVPFIVIPYSVVCQLLQNNISYKYVHTCIHAEAKTQSMKGESTVQGKESGN